jgi:hypothetical protein
MADNAFIRIDDWARAQQLADALSPDQLHRILDHYAGLCCPVCDVFGQTYHWSLRQVEYATDLAFRSTATLGPLYDQLIRQSVLSVKAEQVASFLGRQISPQPAQEVGSQFSTRIARDVREAPLQAPPQGGTPARAANPRTGSRQEKHLQPDRPARDPARLQPALSCSPLGPGRLLHRRFAPSIV